MDHAANESYSKRGHSSLFKSLEKFVPKKTPAGAGSTGRTKKANSTMKPISAKALLLEGDTKSKKPIGAGSTGRMKKDTTVTKPPSVKDTFGVSDTDLKTWWYHPYSKRGLEINKQIKKKIGSRALTNLVVFSMDSASKGQKADSAAFKYVKGLTKFTRKNLKVDAMK